MDRIILDMKESKPTVYMIHVLIMCFYMTIKVIKKEIKHIVGMCKHGNCTVLISVH